MGDASRGCRFGERGGDSGTGRAQRLSDLIHPEALGRAGAGSQSSDACWSPQGWKEPKPLTGRGPGTERGRGLRRDLRELSALGAPVP